MEKLLHDSFANYVVQTSLDFADEDQRAEVGCVCVLSRCSIISYPLTSWLNAFVLYCLPFEQHPMVSVFTARFSVIPNPTVATNHNLFSNHTLNTTMILIIVLKKGNLRISKLMPFFVCLFVSLCIFVTLLNIAAFCFVSI